MDLKDRTVESVKSKASDLSQEFKAYKDDAKNEVKQASDDLNDSVQNA